MSLTDDTWVLDAPVWDGHRVLALSVEADDQVWVNRLWAWDVGAWKRLA
jgi:hypothetical protein